MVAWREDRQYLNAVVYAIRQALRIFDLDMGFQTLLAPTVTFKALFMAVGETLGALKAQA